MGGEGGDEKVDDELQSMTSSGEILT